MRISGLDDEDNRISIFKTFLVPVFYIQCFGENGHIPSDQYLPIHDFRITCVYAKVSL